MKPLRLLALLLCPVAAPLAAQPLPPDVPIARVAPRVVTEPVKWDTDDPAIWIHPEDRARSLVVGTDKNSDGALYVFNLQGKIEQRVGGLRRPNNVDIAHGLPLGGTLVDLAVTTEREAQRLRAFRLPSMEPADRGDLVVFDGNRERAPMGIALYKRPRDGALFAIVGGKSGPAKGYLHQYRLEDDGTGFLKMTFVREFGAYSGKNEIEAIAVDAALGYVYYSDEGTGVRKYHADPDARRADQELALFATSGFAGDHEGISIYPVDRNTGYLLVSDQAANRFWIFRREGEPGRPHEHHPVKIIETATTESDGSDVVPFTLTPQLPGGLFVAMSSDKTFQYYAWDDIAGRELRRRPDPPALGNVAPARGDPSGTAPAAAPAAVTRGPYLQLGTPTSIVARWRTDRPVPSVVRFGPAPDRMDREVRSSGEHTEHVVHLDHLHPATRYYYAIGTERDTFDGGPECTFVTHPPPGPARPTRVWVLGDSGTATQNQRNVRDAYKQFSAGRETDLWLMLGDNAYERGSDDEYQKAMFDIYPKTLRRAVVWSTLGNHDAGHAHSITQSGVYYDIFTLPTLGQAGGVASGTEAYYSFDYANIHFVCLDSHDTDRSRNGAMMRWLKEDLAATTQEWIVAFFHHPPYSKGSHDSDNRADSQGRLHDMREVFMPVLEDWGVDLVLTGHSHSYERSHLIAGHYGQSETLRPEMIRDRGDGRPAGQGPYRKPIRRSVRDGHVSIVAGSSGKISGGKLNHPVMFVSLNELGSLVLDFDGGRLDATFVNDKREVRDTFTIVKDAAAEATKSTQ
jgi:myo-inositol-hexaphosphate 3-phosphohydrolase